MNGLRRIVDDLWRGDIPMARVFWEYAVVYGTTLNFLTTIASFAVLASSGSAAWSLAVFFLPVPYNLLMIVSVWRSAARYDGPEYWVVLARSLILVWAAIATFI